MLALTRFAAFAAALFIAAADVAVAQDRTRSNRSAQPAAGAEDGSRRTLRAAPVTAAVGTPVIDGRLDDAIWASAAAATDFVQRAPQPGAPATHRTEAWVAYDADAIYVAMRMYDPAPDSIAAQLARRDATGIFSDWADVLIDSYNDRRTAYRFSVNPAGVQKDVFHYNDTQEDLNWDAVWQVATAIDELGWTAEFRIPLSQLRFTTEDGRAQRWGLNFSRQVARLEETSFWAPVLPGAQGFVSIAGDLLGLEGLRSPRRLEILPYAVTRLTRAPAPAPVGGAASPFFRATDPGASVGADVRYGVSSNLTLTATVNPDFGQVEADPSVVNLTAVETFFPERRPFFLEGANLFAFDLGDDGSGEGLFYSRRIGRAPQRSNFAGAHFSDVPDAARILGAAKITGRSASGWSLGVFNAVTGRVNARLAADGVLADAAAEPLSNYAAGRLTRDFRGGMSTVGVMATTTHRDIDDDALRFLRSAAYGWGVNARHRFGSGNRFQVSGQLAGSSIFGDTLALQLAQRSSLRYFQRPDAGHVEYDPHRTSLHGLSGQFGIDKISGGRWSGGVGTVFRTPGFEVNDAGFQTNADQRFVYGWFNFNSYEPGALFRRWNVGLNPNAGWNFDGTRLWTQVNTWGGGQLLNFWNVNYNAGHGLASYSTGALRGGPAIRRPGFNRLNVSVTTDRRKPLFVNFGGFAWREHETHALQRNVFASVTARPTSQLDLSLGTQYSMNTPVWQYVATVPARTDAGAVLDRREYLFAELDQTTTSLTARVSYTLSPTLSFQLYAQPFLSAGHYTTFRRVADPLAHDFDDRFQTYGADAVSRSGNVYRIDTRPGEHVTFNTPDFSIRQLRSNAVLRWEYRPGSTLFAVWSQQRSGFEPDGRFDLGRDFDRLTGAPATNVLLLKVSYWLDN